LNEDFPGKANRAVRRGESNGSSERMAELPKEETFDTLGHVFWDM
jgi:hypothetical protein